MKIKYEVEHYQPESEWISIKWTSTENPELFTYTQFEFPDFSREKLVDHLNAVASRILGAWSRIPNHPKELTIPKVGTLDVEPEMYLPYEPNPQPEPEPEYDPWTQRAYLVDNTDDQKAQSVPWVVEDLTEEEQQNLLEGAAYQLREERLHLLSLTDGIFAPDTPPLENMDEWLEFRQALRDIPQQPNFPKEVVWPVRPDLAE